MIRWPISSNEINNIIESPHVRANAYFNQKIGEKLSAVSSSAVLRDFAFGAEYEAVGSEYDQNFLGPYTGLNSEHSIAAVCGRKREKSEQKGGKRIESDAVASRPTRTERASTSAYRFERFCFSSRPPYRGIIAPV